MLVLMAHSFCKLEKKSMLPPRVVSLSNRICFMNKVNSYTKYTTLRQKAAKQSPGQHSSFTTHANSDVHHLGEHQPTRLVMPNVFKDGSLVGLVYPERLRSFHARNNKTGGCEPRIGQASTEEASVIDLIRLLSKPFRYWATY